MEYGVEEDVGGVESRVVEVVYECKEAKRERRRKQREELKRKGFLMTPKYNSFSTICSRIKQRVAPL